MSDDFPGELKVFVAQHVESLAQLEALLLLKQNPSQTWSSIELAQKLYITVDMCRGLVGDLERRGFVERLPEDRFQYRSPDAESDRRLGELEALYQTRRVAVITEIYSKPVHKVQTFADAFRLRREE